MGSGLKHKDIDLLSVYKQKKEPSKYADVWKYALFPGGMLLLIAGVMTYFMLSNSHLESDTEDLQNQAAKIQEQIAKDPNLETYNSLEDSKNEIAKYEKLKKEINSYPELSQDTFDKILLAADVDVTISNLSYTRDSQIVTMQIEAASVSSTEGFVRRLKNTAAFATVDYSGYTQSEKSTETATDTTTSNNTTSATENNDAAALLGLLDQLNQQKQENTTQTQKTTKVYTATILCTLK